MNTHPKHAWIHAGNCPVCQCGLRRPRLCEGGSAEAGQHGYVLCDDCETIWLQPDPQSTHCFPECELPACPVCHQSLFGPQARWASEEDLFLLGWNGQFTVEQAIGPRPDF